ncbi:hypothetical protein PM082_023113 [Marasmius tenuissimus]|nr:hypothetical protein PM082_023113 [Marasmius tenuissimus]
MVLTPLPSKPRFWFSHNEPEVRGEVYVLNEGWLLDGVEVQKATLLKVATVRRANDQKIRANFVRNSSLADPGPSVDDSPTPDTPFRGALSQILADSRYPQFNPDAVVQIMVEIITSTMVACYLPHCKTHRRKFYDTWGHSDIKMRWKLRSEDVSGLEVHL